ncbi:Com family DNA-binding transcriptional regulator [Glaesserella sp.]
MQQKQFRCRCCNKLLAKGSAMHLQIKCVRCKTINQF